MSQQGARIGKGKAIHLYFVGSAQVACGADGMIAGTATPCAGDVTCKRCLKWVATNAEQSAPADVTDVATDDATALTTYSTVDEALAVPVAQRAGQYLVLHVKAGWYEWLTELDLDELDSYGFEDEFELIETSAVIPLDLALALVAAQVITQHPDPVEHARAADVLRALEGGGSVTTALDAAQFSGTLPTNPPAFVDSSLWEDPDNG